MKNENVFKILFSFHLRELLLSILKIGIPYKIRTRTFYITTVTKRDGQT